MMVVRLINSADAPLRSGRSYECFWVRVGVPIALFDGFFAQVLEHVIDDQPELVVKLMAFDFAVERALKVGECVDMSSFAFSSLVPRAIRLDGLGRADKVLIDLMIDEPFVLCDCDV